MRAETHSLEHRIRQVQFELASARKRLAHAADQELAEDLQKEIVRNDAVLRLLKRTEHVLRSIDQE